MTSKQNFGRIHRSSLGVMGLLRLNFKDKSGQDAATADHAATFSLTGLNNDLNPRQEVTLTVKNAQTCAYSPTHVHALTAPASRARTDVDTGGAAPSSPPAARQW